ncbi:MAG: DUF190 domain-containing protein [Dokdonella sp.]
MKGCSLRFYVQESQIQGGQLLYEWLLEQAKQLGIGGGSAFRSIAGFGRHGKLREQHFFELAGSTTVLIEFLVSRNEADTLLALAHDSGVALFYACIDAEFGVIASASERP